LIDDDEATRNMLVAALQASGHTVETSTSAFGVCNRAAGRQAEAAPRVEVVVLELNLPGLSGTGALELLAKDMGARDVPVVLNSGADRAQVAAAAALHPRCYVVNKDGQARPLLVALREISVGTSAEKYNAMVRDGILPRRVSTARLNAVGSKG
jgi:CheY-like chemotaxis protein